ncbi:MULTISPECIES: aldehyde dehydrogenase [Mycolicibacterium]|jgi:acyl-CoA reductase-like NAD-dependent aldehyde dehydrogenase|uniref:Aldehyde dehydrogenase n=1 Tax=Mycolicibacterium senegalense TaxID=1796 RepID=A0ABR5FP48_9MYCO|nr:MULTISPECIES: aldehyde dehydrogenase [Mycolicibacterium]KLI08822.1 aldehyde dehydrogenase [Mycolicibacterium senegalense]KLO48513.1 aldehyde dehydrogenase [Mycolicibacterium senegalense]OBJ93725.1 aldehyde dehydrogenase [Mycolicibacterium conceptionense]OMB78691.1 aldehyde dehydrogenase [Mycolicibacterium conceptionense]OMC01308.1 aldehyde dehydrogenase [Mycolicibacterium conceptionense]
MTHVSPESTSTAPTSAVQPGQFRDILNPATGEVIATLPEQGEREVDTAVSAARRAFEVGPWPSMVRSDRAKLLLRIADAIENASETLYTLETRNNGRPITETRAQLSRVPEWFRYNAGLLAAQRQAVLPGDGPYLSYQQRLPLGVCGIITPFNHPMLILARSLSAALANGNTVVVKPSELTPLTTLALADIITEAGLPDGVLNVVTGARAAGERLTHHPDIAKITLTGGTEAGRSAAVATASRFARITAELGGKTPVLLFDDVDPAVAAEGAAFAAFVAAGQSCVAGSRFLVQRGIYDEFVGALAARAQAIRLGDPALPGTQMGPLISARQRDKVAALVQTGLDEGATLKAGGRSPALPSPFDHGFFLSPTVLSDATMTMTVAREEIFGPVAVVIPFDDECDAVRMANDNAYGLGAGLWTTDVSRAHRVAAQINAGMVWVNDHHRLEPSLPWGGIKESGSGKDAGTESFEDFSWVKTIVVRTAADHVDWYGDQPQRRLN